MMTVTNWDGEGVTSWAVEIKGHKLGSNRAQGSQVGLIEPKGHKLGWTVEGGHVGADSA